MMKRVILDTDIGSDVDDALALILCLKLPEIKLEAVTTVYGDVKLRARIALKLIKLAGFEVPVAAGIEKPLLRERKIWWGGHEGEGLLTPEDADLEPISQYAIDLIVSWIISNPGEISLICIGPLTNIAASIIKEPRIIKEVKEVIIMGGVARLSHNSLELPYREHNVKSDPEAARIVFNSGMPITMVGLDMTTKVKINRGDVERLSRMKTPLMQAAVSLINRYLEFKGSDSTCMHDPLAVALAVNRSFITSRKMKVLVETGGDYATGQTIVIPAKPGEVTVEVGLEVDASGFLKFFLERIGQP